MRSTRYPVVRPDSDRDWQKYCGFLDLTAEQFMGIQETLLAQQIKRIGHSALARKLMGERVPRSVDEFRNLVPLTTYQDYLPELEQADEASLPEKPCTWAHTSGATNGFKRVPYTQEFYHHALDSLMAAFILACSKGRGHSSLREGDRVLFNVAPRPYLSGILASGACEMFNLRPVMSHREHDSIDFKEKVRRGFETSLRTGADILIAMTSVLVKLGDDFGGLSQGKKRSRLITHPMAACRLARGFLRSRLEGRGLLPKDLWSLKAIIGWGADTAAYRELVQRYWGMRPYELHACTEAGIIALQTWSKRDLTLIPYSNFFEFIPEDERLRCKDSLFLQPTTVLLSELKPGERYELVISSFHGMPFIRYRLGHLMRVTALEDTEAGVRLPQMVFETRADDLIDVAGFARLSEKTVAEAIASAGLRCEDWSLSKQIINGDIRLNLYMELNEERSATDVAALMHEQLVRLDPGYHDLDTMMGIRPLQVTLLHPGTFADYYSWRKEMGAELLQRKPPRMNPPDDAIRELLRLSEAREAPVATATRR